MAEVKAIIGLETHVQLATETKLFCSCPITASAPNSSVCPVCLGMPGSKPVLNRKAVDFALRIALALNCEINREFFFSRKTYFYPDLAKNYQITQYETPVGKNGFLLLKNGKRIRIQRVHLEEDPASLVHDSGIHSSKFSLVDYNRSGISLVEIVSFPDMETAAEAKEFLDRLVLTLSYLNVFVPGKTVVKADCNVSVSGGNRVEIKNVNGQRAVEKAVGFEIARQSGIIAKGEKVARETRSFDDASLSTKPLREKETEEDYGYIFDPDLAMVELSEQEISSAKQSLPELFDGRQKRLVSQYGLDAYTAEVLSSNFALSNLFFELVGKVSAKTTAYFLTRELSAILNRDNLELSSLGLDAGAIADLLSLLEEGKITEKNAKEAMIAYVHQKINPADFIKKNSLLKDLASSETEKIVEKIISQNQKAVSDFLMGEEKSMNFLVGLVMRETKSKADPKQVREMIEKKIRESK